MEERSNNSPIKRLQKQLPSEKDIVAASVAMKLTKYKKNLR
jgi:hypothetical protein